MNASTIDKTDQVHNIINMLVRRIRTLQSRPEKIGFVKRAQISNTLKYSHMPYVSLDSQPNPNSLTYKKAQVIVNTAKSTTHVYVNWLA